MENDLSPQQLSKNSVRLKSTLSISHSLMLFLVAFWPGGSEMSRAPMLNDMLTQHFSSVKGSMEAISVIAGQQCTGK